MGRKTYERFYRLTSGTGSEVLSAFNTVLKARVHTGGQREKTHKGLKGNKTLFGDNMTVYVENPKK